MTRHLPSRRAVLLGAGAAALAASPLGAAAPALAATPSPPPSAGPPPSRRSGARLVAAGVRDKMTWWDATSTAGPALLHYNYVPILAWRGDRNSRNLTVANVIAPPRQLAGSSLQKWVLADASEQAPALMPSLVSSTVAHLAWTGINGGRSLNVANLELDAGANRFTGRVLGHVLVAGNQVSSRTGPSWAQSDPHQINTVDQYGNVVYASETGDLTFGPLGTLNFIQPYGTRGPVRRFGNLWYWTAADGALCFAFTGSPNPTNESPRVARSAQSSLFEPSHIAYAEHAGNALPCIAWTGIDGAGYLNIAPIDYGAVQAGNDPIGTVYTLPETSIGAPAMGNEPPYGSNYTARTVIFWTGADGTGALNACEVTLP
ncbi:hypothetical protein [Embleya sp. AB8]|uniref:hypothetical protein n=1 Tax=Embleya sp. AB8 TaxID=3156304 RepID=UPI003C786FB2